MTRAEASPEGVPLLEVQGLKKTFQAGREQVLALRGVDLTLRAGQILGLAGESGSGKSTLARMLAGSSAPSSGQVRLEGRDVTGEGLQEGRWFKERVQMVFQDPATSLNPRRTVAQTLEVPLRTLGLNGAARQARLLELLDLVELGQEFASSYPGALSGGQKQRVAVARALAINPRLIVLDEPTSALDVSVQAKVIGLLLRLREQLGLAYLFISHDLSLMRNVADETAILYLGRVVEQAPTTELFARPQHPYTRMLLSAIPVVSEEEARLKPAHTAVIGEIPSASQVPSGCTFHTRCPFVISACTQAEPELAQVGPSHVARCIRIPELRAAGVLP
ncbi:oligopeptide/dipeptide ABC transporter ATP-binding protein [Deinococcus sp. UYEF24]